MKVILHSLTLIVIEIGLFIVYLNADFTKSQWVKYYYVWDKSIALLLILCAIFPLRIFRPYWIAVGIVFVFRILWEIPAIQNYELASTHEVKKHLFLTDFACIILVFINQITKCRKLK